MKKLIGSHVGLSGPSYYEGTVKEALSYGENCFMFYTGAPQNAVRKPLEELNIEAGKKLIKEAGIDESKIVVHAPYIINLSCNHKPDSFEFGKQMLKNEILRTEAFGASLLVLHPGSYLDGTIDEGIETLASALNEVLSSVSSNVIVCLETMAGKGHEVGRTFEEIAKIINLCSFKDRVGVCLDTCHINDAGYDVSSFDDVLDEFDEIIGLEKLKVIHLNDSMNPRSSHKDRHDNIGYGTIGFDSLLSVVDNPRVAHVPKILETPWYKEKPPYGKEVSLLQSGVFEPGWRDNL